MKEMKYGSKRIIEILDKGNFKGFNYYIMSLGTHPTAYIEIPKEHKLFNKTYYEVHNYIDLEVHFGLTYSRNYLYIDEKTKLEGWFIGWDYAHCDDYTGYEEKLPIELRVGGKKWTTEEILEDVKDVIEQIIKLEKE